MTIDSRCAEQVCLSGRPRADELPYFVEICANPKKPEGLFLLSVRMQYESPAASARCSPQGIHTTPYTVTVRRKYVLGRKPQASYAMAFSFTAGGNERLRPRKLLEENDALSAWFHNSIAWVPCPFRNSNPQVVMHRRSLPFRLVLVLCIPLHRGGLQVATAGLT